ncbi:hypothetical protein AB205_0120000, partial [Aquarana catesbeiana]
ATHKGNVNTFFFLGFNSMDVYNILLFTLVLIIYIVTICGNLLIIMLIPSFSGKLKPFSTCSSHLIVVFIFYGTLIAMYVLPNEGQSQMIKKIMSMLYTVFTPFLNPFLYSLRNKDIKDALRNALYTQMMYYLKPLVKIR